MVEKEDFKVAFQYMCDETGSKIHY